MVSLKEHRKFLSALAIFTFFQLTIVFLRWDKPLVWDSSVYVGMGKFLFSAGKIGFWEHFRPPAIPFLIGPIWKTGLFFPNLARLIATAISVSGLAAIYRIVDIDFDRELALYTVLIIMATSVYIRWGHYLLTGIPAAALSFTAIHFAYRKRPVESGLVCALAFFTRFPAMLVAPAAVLTFILANFPLKQWFDLSVEKKQIFRLIKSGSLMGLACAVPVTIYFTLNGLYGKGFLSPIISGASVPTLNPDKYFYGLYFLKEAVIANPLLIFVSIGLFYVFKNRDDRFYGFAAGLALFYGFFTFYPHKEPRFMILFLPLMALFAAQGIKEMDLPFNLPSGLSKGNLIIGVLAVTFVFNAATVYNMNTWENDARNQYMSATSKLNGTVAGLNPAPVVFGGFNFMALRPEHYEKTSVRVFRQADYFTLDTCSWYCAPAIDSCQSKKEELIQRLETKKKIFESSNSQCRYAIYKVN